jgi:hypothetical protein
MSGGSPRNIRPAFTAEEAIVVERALKRAVAAAATPDAV